MTQDQGASARADRATRASPEPASGLGQKASVPCAFTPGPWVARGGSVVAVDEDGAQQEKVARCFGMLGDPRMLADARLIAAAPQLYEALEAARGELESASILLRGLFLRNSAAAHDTARKAGLALAKARGQ